MVSPRVRNERIKSKWLFQLINTAQGKRPRDLSSTLEARRPQGPSHQGCCIAYASNAKYREQVEILLALYGFTVDQLPLSSPSRCL